MADFNDYFGEVYLDLTVNNSSVATVQFCFFILFLLFGGIVFILELYEFFSFNRVLNSFDSMKLEELNSEINDKEAFYYEKAHLYLTIYH